MLKAVRFTTTWLGQLCISTTWRGSYPFPSRPLNMKNLYLQQIFRLERPSTRGLHTFVSLPTSEAPPTMASHGGIPSHMVINPEPHLRPASTSSPPDSAPSLTTGPPRLPISMPDPGPAPISGTTTTMTHPRVPTRTTIPVPARSKQRSSSLIDPQPKKKQKGESIPESRFTTNPSAEHSASLPIPSDARSGDMNSAASESINYHHGTVTAPLSTPTLTLTPNPKAPPSPPLRILHPVPTAPLHEISRPWTNAHDQELISMKQDTKSRPSWKTIGARLHRDPQVCKMRWGILKQTPGVTYQPGRINPPHEPEGED